MFLTNVCKFKDCGIILPNLEDLICHIEKKHIEKDAAIVEKMEKEHPQNTHLSYVLPYMRKTAISFMPYGYMQHFYNQMSLIKQHSSGNTKRTVNPHDSMSIGQAKGREVPPVVYVSDDSDDSWTNEEVSADFILLYGSRQSFSEDNSEKPFACPVPGCKKRYKNINGIKYHAKNGHKKNGPRFKKEFKCFCGKSYNTPYGLWNHTNAFHSS